MQKSDAHRLSTTELMDLVTRYALVNILSAPAGANISVNVPRVISRFSFILWDFHSGHDVPVSVASFSQPIFKSCSKVDDVSSVNSAS